MAELSFVIRPPLPTIVEGLCTLKIRIHNLEKDQTQLKTLIAHTEITLSSHQLKTRMIMNTLENLATCPSKLPKSTVNLVDRFTEQLVTQNKTVKLKEEEKTQLKGNL